ncbi:MAG: GatB/YqeY domain-containing protein [bacterium]
MGIKEDIEEDFKQALKDQDKERMSTLRMIKSAIQEKEKEEGEELSDEDVISILSKEVKSRRDSIEQYEEGDRGELAEKEAREVEIIEGYLPEPLSEEELEDLIDQVIEDVGASDMSDMGQVMGKIMPEVRGRADGDEVNQKVNEKLSS